MAKHIELLNNKFGFFIIDIKKSPHLFASVTFCNLLIVELGLFGFEISFGYIR